MGREYGRTDYEGKRHYTVEIVRFVRGYKRESICFHCEADFVGYSIPARTNCANDYACDAEGDENQVGETRWSIEDKHDVEVSKETFAAKLLEAIEDAMNAEDLEE